MTKAERAKTETEKGRLELAKLFHAYQVERELGQTHYKRSDEIMERILKAAPLQTVIDIGNGYTAELVDNFAEGKLKVFRAHGISRYEVKLKPTLSSPKPKTPKPGRAKTTIPAHESKQTSAARGLASPKPENNVG